MRYNVKLKYFNHYDLGKGFAHTNTFEKFDPFWDASGIFHDVFEHYFEGTGVFAGNNKCNILGEIVATAHKYFFYHELCVNSFKFRSYSHISDWTIDTKSLLLEKISNGYDSYDYFDIGLPKSKKTDISHLERIIEEYISEVEYEQSKPDAYYKIDSSLIADAYRYGYKLAKRRWEKNCVWKSGEVTRFMNNFLDKWNDITKLDRDFLRIDDDSAYQLNYINFNIDTVRLTCTERLVDELGNTYNIKKLYSCSKNYLKKK